MRPHRRQPTRLPHPRDSPGKNTGVGCHFLLQCMKVKSESDHSAWYNPDRAWAGVSWRGTVRTTLKQLVDWETKTHFTNDRRVSRGQFPRSACNFSNVLQMNSQKPVPWLAKPGDFKQMAPFHRHTLLTPNSLSVSADETLVFEIYCLWSEACKSVRRPRPLQPTTLTEQGERHTKEVIWI